MSDLIEGFARHQRRRGLAPATIDKRTRYLRLLESERGLDLTREQLEEWLDSRGVVAKSRSCILSHYAAFYHWAQESGHTEEDPTARIQRPKLRRKLPRPIPDADLSRALAGAKPEMRCWLLLGALAGLRCQEIAGLAVEDVLDDEGLLRVVEAKGGTERLVPLHPEVWAALAKVLPERGPVFRGQGGKRITPGQVSHKTGDYLHSLGIKSTPHALRHFFGSKTLRVCHDVRVVQELLGHKSISSTAVYTAFDQQAGRAAVGGLTIVR